MAASTAQTATRRSRAEQREDTRNRMLQSALDIIIEEGIRSVRHRAVAQRAEVSLGSTTYHFSSIEELIVNAFQYWRSKALLVDNPFFLQTGKLLSPMAMAWCRPVIAPESACRFTKSRSAT